MHGTSQKEEKSKAAMRCLKTDKVLSSEIPTSEYLARKMKKEIKDYPFTDFFNSNTILVPIPKSSLPIEEMLWVPERITTTLVKNGLGKSSESCLERITYVARSSGQRTGSKRPSPLEHYKSMRVRELLFEPKEIVAVDDVVTRGATFLGGINRLAEAFPKTKIRAFAIMRSINKPEDFSDTVEPVIGTIIDGIDGLKRRP